MKEKKEKENRERGEEGELLLYLKLQNIRKVSLMLSIIKEPSWYKLKHTQNVLLSRKELFELLIFEQFYSQRSD